MPSAKLIKIREAEMLQITKIRGLKGILACVCLMASITMPQKLWSQPVPDSKEWVVVIDAGHGGKDPGALGSKSREKNINLAVALKTGKYIKDNIKDVKVIYTRDDDTYPGLAERAETANKNKADLFISIHSNALTDKRFTGAETYVLGQTMDEANLQVAMKENSVITFEKDYQTKYEGFDPNSVESYIIFSLMQNTYLKQSTEFATLIQNQFRERVGRKDRGVRQAGFVVLWRTTMPSVLVELGYITNSEEEKFLMSEEGQDYLASAIFRAFRDYKQAIDSRSGLNSNNISRNGTPPADTVKETVRNPVAEEKPETPADPAPAADSSAGEIRPEVNTGEIFFMVQFAAVPRNSSVSRNQLPDIDTVTMIDDGERIKYAAGNFALYEDAVRCRRLLAAKYPDAFVIAVRDGKIIPLRQAIEARKLKSK
jgi:N-acetylmuramoyl-L-alanine amidase